MESNEAFVGLKSYPLPLAKAMEELVRDMSEYEHGKGVGALFDLTGRAIELRGVLNKWR